MIFGFISPRGIVRLTSCRMQNVTCWFLDCTDCFSKRKTLCMLERIFLLINRKYKQWCQDMFSYMYPACDGNILSLTCFNITGKFKAAEGGRIFCFSSEYFYNFIIYAVILNASIYNWQIGVLPYKT